LHPAWERGAFYVDDRMNLKARASKFEKYEKKLSFDDKNGVSAPQALPSLLFTKSSLGRL